jgi:hypothetical protein
VELNSDSASVDHDSFYRRRRSKAIGIEKVNDMVCDLEQVINKENDANLKEL